MSPTRRLIGLVVFACASLTLARGPVRAETLPRPLPALDYRAYDAWNAIKTPKLSDDGASLAYALTPQDGDPTLVVRALEAGTEKRELRGANPLFAAGGRYVVFTHVASKKDIDAAKKAKKTEAQQPKAGVGILDLQNGARAEIVDSIKTIAVARDEGPTIAYLAEPSPSPSPSPSPAPSASASGSPAPKADKTKANGAPLTIRNLDTGTNTIVANATDVVISQDDRFIAYTTQNTTGTADGVHVFDVVGAKTRDIATGVGRYRNLTIARDGTAIAYLSDVKTYANDVPIESAYVVDLRAASPTPTLAVDARTAAMPSGFTPNTNGALAFSRDGKRLFLGTAPEPTPMPSGTPEPTKVDLWSYRDDILQSQQKHDADTERKRTYLGVYDLANAKYVQLGTPDVRDIDRNENANVALGSDDRAGRRAQSWLGQRYADLYAIGLADGKRRLIARQTGEAALSPGGRYAIAWDERARLWYAVRTSDGMRVTLGARAGVRFDLEDDDHPQVPQPYGTGGWLADDRAVMLYDRYDVWLADPQTGAVVALTRGLGRRTHVIYSPVQSDPDALAFAPETPIVLSLLDERTFASGFARVAATGGVPQTLLHLDEAVNAIPRPVFNGSLHDLGRPPLVARHADRGIISRETFRMDRDLWSTTAAFTNLAKVTTANPEREHFRWGNEHLIDYHATDGTPLRAVMLVPDDAKRNRKAPLLVYFYERFSDLYHTFYQPAPGTSPNFMRYVSNGYVVMLVDVKYRIGHPGASAVNCILPAVDVAVASGYVDPTRVGIAGHSWAAYQINYLITKSKRFRAVEAGAAVDDMFSAYSGIRLESGIVRESQYEHTQSRIGATPWDRPDLYLENSGLFGIKNVTTPYLTIHNDQDGAVPQFQGIEYLTAMRRLGKEAYLFSFDGEEHNLKGREQQKYWTVHLDEWFDYWLKDAPRPDWMNGVDYLHRGERDIRPLFGESDERTPK